MAAGLDPMGGPRPGGGWGTFGLKKSPGPDGETGEDDEDGRREDPQEGAGGPAWNLNCIRTYRVIVSGCGMHQIAIEKNGPKKFLARCSEEKIK